MILLDTHVVVWLDQDDPSLGASCRALVESAMADGDLVVSAISFWEVKMLVEKHRLSLDIEVSEWRRDLLAAGVRELPIDGQVGIQAASLGDLHRDPADRIIVATAQLSHASLATADKRLLDWQSDLSRIDARA